MPEGEHHELGLLFMYYLMKSRGIKIYYLGANVPLKDVAYVVKVKQPDIMYTHLTSVTHHFNLEKMLHHIHTEMPQIPVFISGQLVLQYKKKVPENIFFKKSLTEVMEYISTIGKAWVILFPIVHKAITVVVAFLLHMRTKQRWKPF